jgi:glycerol-3-phosphate acyltransferase PlsX
MKIGLDVSGGDFAPKANVQGAIYAQKELLGKARFFLFGDEEEINLEFARLGEDPKEFVIVHAPEIINMHDHPTRALSNKPQSSISVGFGYLENKKIDVFASTGNTGAMLVGAIYKINTIPGVIRPCIAATIPCLNGNKSVLLDVGSNADCKADVLYQFAELGVIYAKNVLGIDNPRVALLNIGEEETKGNLLTQAAYKLLDDSDFVNFVGNIEGRDLYMNIADVIVCDGFTGNIVLKQAEGFFNIFKNRGLTDTYLDKFNYENYGGTPILGVQGNVVIGHGISNENAVKNMLMLAFEVSINKLSERIINAFK